MNTLKVCRLTLLALLAWKAGLPIVNAQETSPPDAAQGSVEERIVTPQEVQEALSSPVRAPLRVISYPFRVITHGMEKGLVKAESSHFRERMRLWTDRLRELGITPLVGGMGEQTGFGGGASYTIGSKPQKLTFLARGTFAHYQEFDVRWTASSARTEVNVAASYQWRPNENFYGLGHQSSKSDHTDFALRQSWVGAHFEFAAPKYFRAGVENKFISTKTGPGQNRLTTSTPDVFPDLPGLGDLLRLNSTGAYVDLDFSEGEYGWTGRAHLSSSYQHGLNESRLRYFNYEGVLEGRMPVRSGQSGFVGRIGLNVNHEKSGSDPIPFYLRPHLGGSSTLRGFALDRFYGKNLMLLSLEYRYRLHPSFEASIFHDAGQIFDRTSQLTWFNWHRNYGASFRLHNNFRTILRFEYGFSREGKMFHISFGDRAPQPIGGAVRYGTYRR